MSFIGKNIKKIRTVKNLSQAGFAQLFNLARPSVGGNSGVVRIAQPNVADIKTFVTGVLNNEPRASRQIGVDQEAHESQVGKRWNSSRSTSSLANSKAERMSSAVTPYSAWTS